MERVTLYPPLQTANVRKEPTTRSPVVGEVVTGQVATLIETNGAGWNHIEYSSAKEGWVFPGVALRFYEPWDGTVDLTGLGWPISPDLEVNEDGWPGKWYDATGYARYYEATGVGAYHTGADLNLKNNVDAGAHIYAIADGEVLYAKSFPVWGNIMVIRHGFNKAGIRIRTRYAHMENMYYAAGDTVKRGDVIATVGNAFGRYSHHLHFDISPNEVLDMQPSHWPGSSKKLVLMNYVDPSEWIREANA